MAIYTKKGDRGETSLYDPLSSQQIRISKDSLRIGAIGAVDEANSFLGIIKVDADAKFKKKLKEIQENLFTIGSILAGAKLRFSSAKTKKLEKEIDKLEENLPILKNFILPGGSKLGAKLHFARTLVRGAERATVSLSIEERVNPEILVYLNRLSDYLFMLAREVNFRKGYKEEVWKR